MIPPDVLAKMPPDGVTSEWVQEQLGVTIRYAGTLLRNAGFKAYGNRWRRHPKLGEPK